MSVGEVLPSGHLLRASARSAELAESVTAELESIFRVAPPSAGGFGAHESPVQTLSARRGHPGARRLGVLAGLMMAMVGAGLAIGSVVSREPQLDPPPNPAVSRPVATAPATPAPVILAPALAGPPEAAPAPTAAAPYPVATAAPPSSRPAAHPRAAPYRKLASAPARGTGAAAACEEAEGAALARCLRPTVLEADRMLRGAYNRAIRAGVPDGTLAWYQERWTEAREEADEDPVRVIRRYRALARQLGLAAEEAARPARW